MISMLVATIAQGLTLLLIARAVLSWFPGPRALAPVTALLDRATAPVLGPLRRWFPRLGHLDLAAFVAALLINVLAATLLRLLAGR